MFPKEIIPNKEFFFGGTVDDPMMNKNVYDICEYVITNDGEVTLETNTGANTKETYERLGKLSKNADGRLHVFPDGLEETQLVIPAQCCMVCVRKHDSISSTGGKCTWQYPKCLTQLQ